MTEREAAALVTAEILSQPSTWAQAIGLAPSYAGVLPRPGQRIAVVGCGTSWFIAATYATVREQLGQGETDAFAASEFPATRRYDLVLAISRSGTTTEVLDLLRALPADQPTLALVGDESSPMPHLADAAICLPFADEQSVVQTRFATTALMLLRAGLGEDLSNASASAEAALAADIPAEWLEKKQFTFLGHGASVGIAHEAALKLREAALAWAESYPAYDYRHGPISLAEEHTLVWILGEAPAGLVDQITATGADVKLSSEDPVATLVHIQRLAVRLALHRGLNPDAPRHLTRSVILE